MVGAFHHGLLWQLSIFRDMNGARRTRANLPFYGRNIQRSCIPMRSRIHHVNIPALRFEETIAFYQDIFDLADLKPNFAKDYNQRGGTRFVGPKTAETSEGAEWPTIHISESTPQYAKAVSDL